MKDVLRFLTCGSVDEGKSTLIGRLLVEWGSVYADQIEALQRDSVRYGTQGDQIDYALLLDGLIAEREQGITIDVAHRYVSTPRRRFIIADSPGHMQYTRNMVTAASTSDLALVLIDVTCGIGVQTRRHLAICAIMGIRHYVVVVNKMDLIGYDQKVFRSIEEGVAKFLPPEQVDSFLCVPASALLGENLRRRSEHMLWYDGETLMDHLETVEIAPKKKTGFVLPVQLVVRMNSGVRGIAGRLALGILGRDNQVLIQPSGQVAAVTEILRNGVPVSSCDVGESVLITLDREVDVARGQVLFSLEQEVQLSNQFQATLVWLSETPGLVGRQFELKLSHQWTTATVYKLKHRLNQCSLLPESATEFQVNEIYKVQFSTSAQLVSLPFAECRELGGFILVDRLSKETVAVGTIDFALRRGMTVRAQKPLLTHSDREKLSGHAAKVVWLTGLSGAGKSAIAAALERDLFKLGIKTVILDGDTLRNGLNKDLGFTPADRVENIRRTAEVAKLMLEAGLVVIVAVISPFRADRDMARALFGDEQFAEVYVATPLEVCEERDPKGLYKMARSGRLPNFTGIDSPYETPISPQITVDTSFQSIPEIVAELKKFVI